MPEQPPASDSGKEPPQGAISRLIVWLAGQRWDVIATQRPIEAGGLAVAERLRQRFGHVGGHHPTAFAGGESHFRLERRIAEVRRNQPRSELTAERSEGREFVERAGLPSGFPEREVRVGTTEGDVRGADQRAAARGVRVRREEDGRRVARHESDPPAVVVLAGVEPRAGEGDLAVLPGATVPAAFQT